MRKQEADSKKYLKFVRQIKPIKPIRNSQWTSLRDAARTSRYEGRNYVLLPGFNPVTKPFALKGGVLNLIVSITCICLVAANTGNNPAFSVTLAPPAPLQNQLIVKSACMEQKLEILITQLLRDLPSYSNRASQRARRLSRNSDIFGYILIAGRPEFQPLPLNFAGSNIDEKTSTTSDVKQVFFSTLERQYINKTAVELEQFHWLFLTNTDNGWRFVVMFTQIGGYSKQEPLTPPRDSSNSAIAEGIKTWLRDCQADSVRVLDKKPSS